MIKRAFITFSYGDNYNKLCDILQKSIKLCSKYDLIIFKPEDFDEDFTPDIWKPGYIYKFKILSCLKSLELYDEVVWLDTDIIVTHNIDRIWNNSIDNYPLLPKHRFFNFENWPHSKQNYRDPNCMKLAKQKTECFNIDFENIYLQACSLFFNKNCYDFFQDVLSYFKDYDNEAFPFGDESIINVLIWKNKFQKNLGDVFLCSHYFSPYILCCYLKLENGEDYPKLFDIQYKHILPSDQDEDIILSHGKDLAKHNRIGIIKNNFDDVLFFHGSKVEWLHKMYLDCLTEKMKN